jgi:hypothetical protein
VIFLHIMAYIHHTHPSRHDMSHLSAALRHTVRLPLQGFRWLRPPRLPPTVATGIGHTTLRDLRVHPTEISPSLPVLLPRDVHPQIHPPLRNHSILDVSIPLHRRRSLRRKLLDHMTTATICTSSAVLSMPLYTTPGNYFIL